MTTADEIWETLDTKSRVCVKSTDHTMANRFAADGELTPAGEGMAWWLTEVFPNADYDKMVDWLQAETEELLTELPKEGGHREEERIYNSQRAIVLRAAQERLEDADGG